MIDQTKQPANVTDLASLLNHLIAALEDIDARLDDLEAIVESQRQDDTEKP
jgi:hypothetical protein